MASKPDTTIYLFYINIQYYHPEDKSEGPHHDGYWGGSPFVKKLTTAEAQKLASDELYKARTADHTFGGLVASNGLPRYRARIRKIIQMEESFIK